MAARGSRAVLFGGAADTLGTPVPRDVWEWDLGAGQWTRYAPGGSWPVGRTDHVMAEDLHRGRVVLFGGQIRTNPRQVFSDTWEWDGALWAPVISQREPGARSSHALAYDPERHRHVLFGGDGASPTVWELRSEPDQQAGLRIAFDASPLGIAPSLLLAVDVRIAGGGDGFAGPPSGSPQAGATTAIWNARKGLWDYRTSNGSAAAGPAAMTLSFSNSEEVQSIFAPGQRVFVLLQSRNGIGAGPGAAHLAAEGAELSARYQLAQ